MARWNELFFVWVLLLAVVVAACGCPDRSHSRYPNHSPQVASIETPAGTQSGAVAISFVLWDINREPAAIRACGFNDADMEVRRI